MRKPYTSSGWIIPVVPFGIISTQFNDSYTFKHFFYKGRNTLTLVLYFIFNSKGYIQISEICNFL